MDIHPLDKKLLRSSTKNGRPKNQYIVLYIEPWRKIAYAQNAESIGWRVSDWARIILDAIALVESSCWHSFVDVLYLIVRLDQKGLRDVRSFLRKQKPEVFQYDPKYPDPSQFVKSCKK